ncbi:unnamed protein product [Schistocephalus solidus]|uniref:C2H2-type domain-containing protein n=1 Tax=Schistocephalus solidus TaxID=70667 RepID=A0A183TFT4_SCHSO|nr:unnamed protein product [Schistocephalus solidus]
MEKIREDRLSNLRGQVDRCRQGQKSSTKVTSAPDKHRRCLGPANIPTLSTHLPRANRPGWTSSDAMPNNSTIPISTSNSANPPSDSPTLTPGINSITPTIKETTSLYSSPVTPTTAFAFTTTTTISDRDSLLNCPQCDRTFPSRIGLVGHLRIHSTETGEPVPGALTHSRDRCLRCPRAFTHRMGLYGHMRIHDSGIHRNADNTDTSCTPSAPAILTATATPTTMNDTPPASTDFSCPHCASKFNSHIGLVGHSRIHRTEAGEPVPGVPTYSLRARLHCPHCSHTFTHRMGQLGHMRLHDTLR